jgi:hypothetical protein
LGGFLDYLRKKPQNQKMALKGGASEESIEHDDASSWQHERDKRAQQLRGAGKVQWIPVDLGEEFKFRNDFSAFGKDEALYFNFGGIPEVRATALRPEPWDVSGSLASYAADSQIAAYREFRRGEGRERRGRKKKDQVESEFGPPAPPPSITAPRAALSLNPIDPKTYKALLRLVRDETAHYSRWGKGARDQWQKVPTATKIKITEGMLPAELLDRDEEVEGVGADEPVAVVKTAHEMERFTVNSHPALARALVKLLAAGNKDKVRELMIQSIPRAVAKFEEVTGRKVVGLSIHWDSDLPHWNLWHTGLERVIFKKGKGADRTRYRRTAMNLNSSGPGLRAWRRSQLALERLGSPTCPATMNELSKAEKKAMEDQGRMPGDWQVNDVADSVLEELLVEAGFKDLVDEGFSEYIENEEKRYEAGLAGKVSRMDKQALASQIRSLQAMADERGAELEGFQNTASVDSTVRKLATDFLELLKQKPRLFGALQKVPVLREILRNLSLLCSVKLDFSAPDVSKEKVSEVVADAVAPGLKGKASSDKTNPALEI